MIQNTDALYQSPYPFILVELVNDNINIIKDNIKNSRYDNVNIDEIKGFIKNAINSKENQYISKENEYKLTFIKLEDKKGLVWLESHTDNESIQKVDSLSHLIHEFKTPLNIIFSSIQLINKKFENSNEISKNEIIKYINIIDQNSYRTLKLINNISYDDKIDHGYNEYNPSNENLVYFIEYICESINHYVVENNMKLIFDTDIEELIVSFDAEMMESIILNLVSNAIKFRKKSNGEINISISIKDEFISISVKDNGIGIEKNELNKIFGKYIRLNNKESVIKEGVGIGLSLVQALVKAHGGNIIVDSEIGKWTEFIISIPNEIVEYDDTGIKYLSDDNILQKMKVEFSDI